MKIRTVAAAAVLVALAAAGCGSDEPSTTTGSALPVAPTTTAGTTTAEPPATAGTTPATPAASEASPVSTRCHTSELAASFTASDAAAGNRYAQLVLTNTARRTCTVYGFGGLQPLDAARKQLPVTLTRDSRQGGPKLVTLAPGATVARTIHWTVVRTGTQKCPEGAFAEIIPPDETDSLVVSYPFGEICGGKLDGTPFGVTL
jgi:hypothetical protein